MPDRPLRFVQTGDWHLGQPYRNVPDPTLGDRLRRERLSSVGRVLGAARDRGAAFVLATGDQFDAMSPDSSWLRGMFEVIASYRDVIVFMIPGNHDPFQEGSVYSWSEFRQMPENLRFLSKSEVVRLPDRGASLFPCPCLDRAGPDPMSWIPPRTEGDGLRIGLAHGSLPNFAGAEERNYPIPIDAPRRYDLDFVAIGDWHTANPDPRDRPNERMYYAGSPEVGGWDETGAGTALWVELDEAESPRVERLEVGGIRWREVRRELFTREDVAALVAELQRIASPDLLVRVKPTGAITAGLRAELVSALADLASGFACVVPGLSALGHAVEDDAPTVADPLIRAMFARLERLGRDLGDGRPEGFSGDLPLDEEVVSLARSRFRRLLP